MNQDSFEPIPGSCHLYTLAHRGEVPVNSVIDHFYPERSSSGTAHDARILVVVAVETAFRRRPYAHLNKKYFQPLARREIALARKKLAGCGEAEILSLHLNRSPRGITAMGLIVFQRGEESVHRAYMAGIDAGAEGMSLRTIRIVD